MSYKLIDVIIPAFNSHKTIKKTLASISIQTIKHKISVIIVNDGGEDYEDIIKFFSSELDLREIKIKNSGPGAARQAGVDSTTNKYIFFVDSDDLLFDCFSIENLLQKISEDENIVYVNSSFIEENVGREYSKKPSNENWLFGNLYQRSFIEENNIRFPEIRANEDVIFNMEIRILAKKLNKKILFYDQVTYLWKWNEKSTTRKNIDNYFYFESPYSVMKEQHSLFKKYKVEETSEELWNALWNAYYFWSNSFLWKEMPEVQRKKLFLAILDFYQDFFKFFKFFDEKEVKKWTTELNYIWNLDYEKSFEEFIEILDRQIKS